MDVVEKMGQSSASTDGPATDRDTCDAFAEWLELAGYVVVCADSAATAEVGLAGRTPAVCILDLRLQAETGIDVLRVLRARLPHLRDTIPIVLTGMERSRAERMIEESQMAGIILLAKPIDPNEITAVIHGALAARPEPSVLLTQRTLRLTVGRPAGAPIAGLRVAVLPEGGQGTRVCLLSNPALRRSR
jgi:DNA-binding response OmpR family regulator